MYEVDFSSINMEGDPSFVINLQSIVKDAMDRTHAAIEAGHVDLLRKAFEAGRARGVDDQLDAYHGPPYADTPEFDEWLIELKRELVA